MHRKQDAEKNMKTFVISGLGQEFFRDIELIAQCFFEEVHVKGANEDQSGDYFLDFTLCEGRPVETKARLRDLNSGEVYESCHQRDVEAKVSGKEFTKRVRQAVKYVFVQVMEKATGIDQPWGILTGIRPVKLFHSLLQEGFSVKEAVEKLQHDYLLHPEKTEILTEIVQRQKSVLPDLYELDGEVSIYIGIPFCPTKCAYCTFPAYAIQGRNGTVEDFLAGLHEEIKAIGKWLKEKRLNVTTIYFGGGTPTSISVPQMDGLFRQLKKHIPHFEKVRELNVEAGRPDTLDEEMLELLRSWNVDRISINPQSFKEETLKWIGRHHTVKETLDKYHLAREKGFTNINMDLIIGLPGENAETFQQTLYTIRDLKPESVTVHTLSFKRGSAMTQNKDKYQVAGREETRTMVKMARDWAKESGYVPYYLYRQKNILGNQENVGYALPGQENMYNIIIMEERQTIIGLGCGAVSKIVSPHTGRITRFSNPKEPKAYIDSFHRYLHKKIGQLDEIYGPSE